MVAYLPYLLSLLLLGCATRAVQTEALLLAPGDLPPAHEIESVPFVDQSDSYCGPATLTMAMKWAGREVSIEELTPKMYTPGLRGTLQNDLVSASRRHGLMAIPIRSLQALLSEVAAGHPVIIFENVALSWAPQWHYALVLGYDLQKQEIVMHSGHDANFHWDMKKFERSWMLGDYWGLVVLPAGELAASAGELAHASAAVGLELAKQNDQAEKGYRKMLEKWPTSLVTLIGLANISYHKGNRKEAIIFLKQAVASHPASLSAQHNLTVALADFQQRSDR